MRGFKRDRRGNVAMLWALMGSGLVGLVGMTVDFTRAQTMRTQLQNAVDGAALAAARGANVTDEARIAAARSYFDAEAGHLVDASTVSIVETSDGVYEVHAAGRVAGGLTSLISPAGWTVSVESEARESGVNLEVAMVLDITGSMSGSRIADLRTAAADLVDIVIRDTQTPYYSRVALVPYSQGVNAGAWAAQARGAVRGPTNITAATWVNGPQRNVGGATRANPVVITSNGHGFQDGETVYISGVNGMTQLNNRRYTITRINNNRFSLNGVNGTGYNNYTNNGIIRRCFTDTCEIQVTSDDHGLDNDDYVYVSGVNGMTQINNGANATWQVEDVTDDTFVLSGSNGPGANNYNNGGTAQCTENGCQLLRFSNASNPSSLRVFDISSCVSERTGPQAYSDAAPAIALVGRNYPADNNPCPAASILPLTSNQTELTNRINGFQAAGSTAGQIGMAWGWYMLSPNFGSMFAGEGRPAPYGQRDVMKIAVLMTDGAFNTTYCSDVISRDAGSGSGNASDHINCNATNGDGFDQAEQLCTAMKNAGVTVYTIGFDVGNDPDVTRVMRNCASSTAQAYSASNGAQLRAAFRSIALSITQLRLSR
ncbi:MAG: ubiquitin-activating E1 FCCH domain-containing protein [Hyphomonadaceae bacterium]